jgi:hypothetical protein
VSVSGVSAEMARLKYLLLAQILFVSCVAFAGDGTASCEIADKSILARTASGLAQVSNVGNIEITCSVPARAFPTTPGGKPLGGLKVATKAYKVSRDGGEKLVPSEVNVTGGMRGIGPVPTGQEGVLFYLHLPLDPTEQDAEAERFWATIQDKMPHEARSEEARRQALERLQQVVYQHRVGRFRVECRVMDRTQVLGIGTVQLEVVFKGRFSDLGLPGVPPA